jgi:predicted HTH transcriptional regulator
MPSPLQALIARGFGLFNPETAVPFQKNPNLSAFFRAIGRADELGSGMRKLMLQGKKYGGKDLFGKKAILTISSDLQDYIA